MPDVAVGGWVLHARVPDGIFGFPTGFAQRRNWAKVSYPHLMEFAGHLESTRKGILWK